MAGENIIEENIAGKLYGAPFLLGHKDESSFNAYTKGKEIQSYDILNEGENLFNRGMGILDDRIKDLKNDDESSEWGSIAEQLKNKTMGPFNGKEEALIDYLKKVNENLTKINEPAILEYVMSVLDYATEEAYASKNFKDMAIEQLTEKGKKNIGKKAQIRLLKGKSEEIANNIAAQLSGVPEAVEKINSDAIYKYFFQNKGLFKGIASYSRRGGTAGELVDTFADALAFSLANDPPKIPHIVNKEMKKIVESTGKAGEKRDSTYYWNEDISFHISIKNYQSLVKRALKQAERQEKETIEVQSTTKFENFFNYIGQQLDPALLSDEELIKNFTSYWANITYGYHYSSQLAEKDREIRQKIDEYITMFATSFIIIGTKGKKLQNNKKNYNSFVHFLFENGKRSFPALFFQFSGLGIIPSYELIEACSQYLPELEREAAKLNVEYYTNTPLQAVDKMSDGISNGNIAKKTKNGGIVLKKGTLRYYGTLEDIKQGRSVPGILEERFKRFVGKMSVKISLEIISESLYEIFRRYGVGGSKI